MLIAVRILVFLVAASPMLMAQSESPAVDVNALVRRAIQHRLEESRNHRPVRYVIRQMNGHDDTTKEVIETKDGDVDRLVAVNGAPLSADADRAEAARLDTLLNNPDQQQQRSRNERKNKARMEHLASLVPDAFVYRLEGVESCTTGQCYRVSLSPNPQFNPPDRESSLFRGVAGTVWIDKTQERLERLDAHFIANVDFGFGILGRVNKGGTVLVEQTDAGGDEWVVTSLKLNVSGKVMMVKSFRRQVDQEMSHYSVIVPMSYREAIELLKKPAN
ncbi:MAG TPA: hypothetical protein VF865_21750 [Acidobacteriaceae bacterium]